jgi:hypothetical protein
MTLHIESIAYLTVESLPCLKLQQTIFSRWYSLGNVGNIIQMTLTSPSPKNTLVTPIILQQQSTLLQSGCRGAVGWLLLPVVKACGEPCLIIKLKRTDSNGKLCERPGRIMKIQIPWRCDQTILRWWTKGNSTDSVIELIGVWRKLGATERWKPSWNRPTKWQPRNGDNSSADTLLDLDRKRQLHLPPPYRTL